MSHVPRSRTTRGRRHRSLKGCTTCRDRHVRCDEGIPSCLACEQRNLPCGGYENLIVFDRNKKEYAANNGRSYQASGPPNLNLGHRRPLYTEKQRSNMSQALLDSTPVRSLADSLQDLDQRSEQFHDNAEDTDIFHGPFGVFRVYQHESALAPELQSMPAISALCNTDGSDATSLSGDGAADESGDSSTPSTMDSNAIASSSLILSTDSVMEASNQDEAFFPWLQDSTQVFFMLDEEQNVPPRSLHCDANRFINSDARIQEVFQDDSLVIGDLCIQHIPSTRPFSPRSGASLSCLALNTFTLNQPQVLLSSGSLGSLRHAALLVNHYNTTVLALLTPIKHSKTPWHVLFMPQIRNCLAAFTLDESLDHACLTAFYGALAISALSLGNVSGSSDWLQQAQIYRQRADENAQVVLRSAYTIPKSAKYKACLMALLTMVYLNMFTAQQDQAGRYLLETEKLIRLRGLKRHKSRKIRTLHHCYVFERLFHETSALANADIQDRLELRDTIESSGVGVYSVDGVLFRLPNCLDLDQAIDRPKDRQTGENDLLLAHLGDFPSTLYPEIFGTPEQWMQLLSLIIRLDQEKGAIERGDTSALDFKAFMLRAKAVEKRIIRLSAEDSAADALKKGNFDHITVQMLRSVKEALLIYFYRQIYDIDRSMLQHKVTIIQEALTQCYDAEPERIYGCTALIWPSFIAAGEANSQEARQFFTAWFSRAAQQSGLPSFNNMLRRIEHKWSERDESYK